MKIRYPLIAGLSGLAALAAAALCQEAVPPEPVAEAGSVEEDWYRVEIGDVSAGWMSSRETRGGGHLTTESTLRFRVRRGSVEATIETATKVVETEDGRPVQAWSKQVLGPEPAETRYKFLADEISVSTGRAGRDAETRRPYPEGEWLMPGMAKARTRQMLAGGAETFTLRTFDPQFGVEPVEITWVLKERDVELEALGRRFVTSRWRQTASFAPQLASQVYLADDGRLIRSSTPMMGMTLEVTLASRREVLAEQGAPELLVSTFIRPDRAIPRPRRTRRAIYELRVDGGELPELPTSGSQAVERVPGDDPGRTVRVLVDLDRPPAAGDPEAEDAVETYLSSSLLIDHEDAAVRRLYDEVVRSLGRSGQGPAGRGKTIQERAEAFRVFVSRHLSDKNLEVLLASAGEVARSRSGDCTEHSALLAALLRADGIPSRVAAGLVYVDAFAGTDNVFGYHMWTQALIGGRWVDLDASFPETFDATHIAFTTTALRDYETALRELAVVSSLIGSVEVRVLETGPPER